MNGRLRRRNTVRNTLALTLLAVMRLALCPLDPGKTPSQYICESWTTKDGLPSNTITAITQTSDGYIWLGTRSGLARFDGVKFTVFNKENTVAISNNHISCLWEDSSGTLWIGSFGGGLVRYKNGVFTDIRIRDAIFSNIILAMLGDHSGSLWIGTGGGGLVRYVTDTSTVFRRSSGLSNDLVYALSHGADGTLWVGTINGLNAYKDGVFTIYTSRDEYSNDVITALMQDREERLWVGNAQSGIDCLEKESFKNYTVRDGLTSDKITDIFQDRGGCLWIGTNGGGLNYLNRDRFTAFNVNAELNRAIISDIYEDREANLWIGTTGSGLHQLKTGRITTFTMAEGLSDDFIRGICRDNEGRLWIGTNNGGLNVMGPESDSRIATISALNSLPVRTVYVNGDSLWVGTRGAGVFLLRAGKIVKHWTRKQGLSSDQIDVITASPTGDMWIGTEGGGLNCLRDGEFTAFTTREGLSSNYILSILFDSHGEMWLGTSGGGLMERRGGAFIPVGADKGFAGNIVYCIHEDAEGVLWVGTDGDGLNRLKDGRWSHFSTRNGLASDAIFQILEDDYGALWCGTSTGIFALSKKELDLCAAGKTRAVTATLYGTEEGMKSGECTPHAQPAGWRDPIGRLWFPTTKGLVMIVPERMKSREWIPPVYIEKAIVDNQQIPLLSGTEIPPGKKRFAFHYTALGFAAPEKVQFRYRLHGIDKDWVTIKSQKERAAYYTNLIPGHYRFLVTAGNGDGVWNPQGATFDFYVRPFFFQTWWFYFLCAGIGMLLITGVFLLRTRHLQKRHHELATLVTERTHELLREKEKTEKMNDQLRVANDLKSQFLSIAAHDLKNPLQFILGNAELIGMETADAAVSRKAEIIFQSSKWMLNLINDLLKTSVIESGQLQLVKTETDVTALATGVVAAYERFAREKEQELILATDPECLAHADEERLKEIMENLVSNAIKFSPAGKRIWISTSCQNRKIRFAVRDEGPGLSAQDQEKIFQRFQRLSAKPTGGETSTGLGLFIVRKLIELHGGRVWVESDPGQGSTFAVELVID